jgi:hypothetical protein
MMITAPASRNAQTMISLTLPRDNAIPCQSILAGPMARRSSEEMVNVPLPAQSTKRRTLPPRNA